MYLSRSSNIVGEEVDDSSSVRAKYITISDEIDAIINGHEKEGLQNHVTTEEEILTLD
jgi:hypothetical protein